MGLGPIEKVAAASAAAAPVERRSDQTNHPPVEPFYGVELGFTRKSRVQPALVQAIDAARPIHEGEIPMPGAQDVERPVGDWEEAIIPGWHIPYIARAHHPRAGREGVALPDVV